jgi:hypothetical protein
MRYFYIFTTSDILCERNDVNRHECCGKIKRENNVNTRRHQPSSSVIHEPTKTRARNHTHTHTCNTYYNTYFNGVDVRSIRRDFPSSGHRPFLVVYPLSASLHGMGWRSPFDNYNCVYRVINLACSLHCFL